MAGARTAGENQALRVPPGRSIQEADRVNGASCCRAAGLRFPEEMEKPVDLNSRRLTVTWGDRERRLLVQARRDGDRRLLDQLFEEMLPLARRLAFKHARSQDQVDDLVQVASLALFKALQPFDIDPGVAFPGLRVPTIDRGRGR